MKIFHLKSNRSRGNTLFIILIVTGLVGFTLAAYLSLLSSQNHSTMRSQAWNSSIPVVEAGIEEALTHLNAHGTTNLACDGWSQAGNVYFLRRDLGPNYFIVTISNWVAAMTNLPLVESRGMVSVPTLTAAANQPFLATGAPLGGLTTNYISRGVRCGTRQQYLFTKAMVAKGNINLMGNNVTTDSFDSGYTNSSTNGRYDSSKAGDEGDVATDSSLTNSFSIGNANIHGHVATGPNGSITIGTNGAVGAKAWQDAGNTGIEPGWSSDDMNVDFNDITPPFKVGLTPGPGIVDGVLYDYVLDNGNYQFISGIFKGKVIVTGTNANLYVGAMAGIKFSGSDGIWIQSNATLNVYANTATADFSGQGVQNQGYASQFFYWGTPNNTSLSYGGNSDFTGVFYAPSADFILGGGGSGDIDFSGASITKTIKMNGHYHFHYDKALGRAGKIRGFVVTSWNEMSQQEVATLPAGVTF